METVACSSAGPGKTVSTTIAGTPESRCSEATRPPSAAAAVRAWSKRTEPTRLSRAKSFSKVLTQGRVLSLESATNWSICCSCCVGFGVQWRTWRGNLGMVRGSLGKKNVGIFVVGLDLEEREGGSGERRGKERGERACGGGCIFLMNGMASLLCLWVFRGFCFEWWYALERLVTLKTLRD